MALTTPWQDSAAAASDEESFGGEVEDVENGNDYSQPAKVMKKKLINAVSRGEEDLKSTSSFKCHNAAETLWC